MLIDNKLLDNLKKREQPSLSAPTVEALRDSPNQETPRFTLRVETRQIGRP
jgi:hypothetical protein